MVASGRPVVLVSGAPGSGKTTLAGHLVTVDTTVPVDVAAVADPVRTRLRDPLAEVAEPA